MTFLLGYGTTFILPVLQREWDGRFHSLIDRKSLAERFLCDCCGKVDPRGLPIGEDTSNSVRRSRRRYRASLDLAER